MKRVICLTFVVLSVFVYEFAIAGRNNPPSAPVTVVNTDDNPVPVSGVVSGDVSIDGTVDVNVTNTTAIPVTGNVILQTQREPVNYWGGCQIFDGEKSCTSDRPWFEVPEGRRLVIENFSCIARYVPEGASVSCGMIFNIIVDETTNLTAFEYIPTTAAATVDDSFITAAQLVKIYMKSGDKVGFTGTRNQSSPMTGIVLISFSLQGYYESAE